MRRVTAVYPLLLVLALPAARAEEPADLRTMGFEQLMDLEVSTAARKEQLLSQTPAAAYVITREDIRRSGASSIPEALRLAPGVAVAQISPSKWSVSIRGFGGRFANKLLVLIDGRTVYTPLFSGTYWELNDVPLEEVQRIEVIRGPGATLWGANAVNGIVNIITRSPEDGDGAYADLAAGSDRRAAGVGRAGSSGNDARLRLYAHASQADAAQAVDGSGGPGDGFDRQQAGFRAGWAPAAVDQVTVQGDLVHMNQGQTLTLPAPFAPPVYERQVHDRVDAQAGNLLARWERSLAPDSEIRLQSYLDYYHRDEITRDERVTTFDLDFQHRFGIGGSHDVLWGLGYRYAGYALDTNPSIITASRSSGTLHTFSGFAQDQVALMDSELWLILGTKVEHNDLTGAEWQPNLRFLWTPDARQTLWGSIARAVRTPSVGERDYRVGLAVVPPSSAANPGPLPLLLTSSGNPDYGSERLIAYELGYRRRLEPSMTLDTAFFYNDYDHLLAASVGQVELANGYLLLPSPVSNDMTGAIYGTELTLDWRPSERWHVQPTLSLMRANFRLRGENPLPEAAKEASARFREGSDPQVQFSLRTGWSPRSDLDLDLWLRYVSGLPTAGYSARLNTPQVDGYLTLDLRAAWRPVPGMEVALMGKNLLQPRHLEGVEEIYPVPAYVPRSVLATFRYRF